MAAAGAPPHGLPDCRRPLQHRTSGSPVDCEVLRIDIAPSHGKAVGVYERHIESPRKTHTPIRKQTAGIGGAGRIFTVLPRSATKELPQGFFCGSSASGSMTCLRFACAAADPAATAPSRPALSLQDASAITGSRAESSGRHTPVQCICLAQIPAGCNDCSIWQAGAHQRIRSDRSNDSGGNRTGPWVATYPPTRVRQAAVRSELPLADNLCSCLPQAEIPHQDDSAERNDVGISPLPSVIWPHAWRK